jgi:pyruvate-ferredoxin/flavodoxin oxidoreductase
MAERACIDGNEAVARVAHLLSEVVAIYPITPASAMGELADAWSAAGRTNLWGTVPEVIEMQSEAGAAGVLHGAAMKGGLATTFTASQGLLLMLPNMFKLAGELTPAVIHVAARTVATHALSIFGDHSDVMAVRTAGWAMLCSSSVQEAHDLALVAHAATLRSRIPFLHFFDGFRTSHEIDRIELLSDEDVADLLDPDLLRTLRARGLSPDRPTLRGSAQNPDVFFQAREAASPFHLAVPDIVQATMDRLGERTGRRYGLVDYHGAPDARQLVVLMGSGAGAVRETVDALVAEGERVGMVTVRLFRPFPTDAFLAALPPSVERIAVLDRTKEPGAVGEPLYQDVVTALAEAGSRVAFERPPLVLGGRYGLSSKEFTPAMVKGILDDIDGPALHRGFTVGIVDDVLQTNITPDPLFHTDDAEVRAVFYGLGSDGTVGANKNTVKIVGEATDLFPQGYFVIDSKKSGSVTVSHLRFGSKPIRSTYLIDRATFVACHQFSLLDRMDVLRLAQPGATFLLNSPYGPEEVWDRLPAEVQEAIVAKGLELWVIDAYRVAREAGLGARINTVMQPCFFVLSELLPEAEAMAAIKASIAKTYGKLGETVVSRNVAAVEASLAALRPVSPPATAAVSGLPRRPAVPEEAPDFVQRVTARMMAGEGDLLPVSALPVDGTFPTGTARWEKRSIAQELPIWDPTICIDCAKCAIVCPHAAIRMKVFEPASLAGAPEGFKSKPFGSKETDGLRLAIQVAPDDCTGCGVCVDVCPARSKTELRHKSLDLLPALEHREAERSAYDFFLTIRGETGGAPLDTVKGSQTREPLFEFSGACAGCGETPYLKLLTQLFGDRLLVANATGCSSIYGGNLPTTPWAVNDEGRGPAWANSLFEDNAEFGLGMRLALDRQQARARHLVEDLAPSLPTGLADEILAAHQDSSEAVEAQRERVRRLEHDLSRIDGAHEGEVRELLDLADELVAKSVWIVGGDGWAYDIGSAGLDHVLASGRNVNVLVLDTEVYSNTGGQASKATPRGAVAKFAARGKPTGKKDLGLIASAYGNVYVAQIAVGANEMQTVRALLEAEAWPGPSLVIAYSTCIAHGIDMATSMTHQKDAVKSGYWPLYRFHPAAAGDDHPQPFQLDSKKPAVPLDAFLSKEARFAILKRTQPERFADLSAKAQADVEERWRLYEQLAGVERAAPDLPETEAGEPTEALEEEPA